MLKIQKLKLEIYYYSALVVVAAKSKLTYGNTIEFSRWETFKCHLPLPASIGLPKSKNQGANIKLLWCQDLSRPRILGDHRTQHATSIWTAKNNTQVNIFTRYIRNLAQAGLMHFHAMLVESVLENSIIAQGLILAVFESSSPQNNFPSTQKRRETWHELVEAGTLIMKTICSASANFYWRGFQASAAEASTFILQKAV